MSFLNESYLASDSYLGAPADDAPQMPAPDQSMMPAPNPDTTIRVANDLIQIPFTDILITKQTALVAAAILAAGAWYFFIYKKN